MMRIALIAGALVVAILSGVMVNRYLVQQKASLEAESRQQAAMVRSTEVLVITAPVPLGGIVTRRTLAWQPWPEASLNAAYITRQGRPDALDKLVESAARQALFAGEPVTDGKLVRRDSKGFLAAILEEGERAVTLKVDDSQALAGLVQPGDRVDVILSHKLTAATTDGESARGSGVSETIVRDVRVLAIDQNLKTDDKGGAKVGKTVTLAVTPPQAETIFLGRQMGVLSFALRSAFSGVADDLPPPTTTRDVDISPLLKAERERHARVLVAARDIAPGALLSDADLAWRAVPGIDADLHVMGSDDDTRSLRGALVATGMASGSPIPREAVVRPSEARFVPLALRPGLRAVSVAIKPQTAVSGFITPGDRVDVLYTGIVEEKSPSAALTKRTFTETVARNVRVLSIEAALNPETGLPQAGSTATLEASPKESEMLSVAASMGELVLVLRPAGETEAPTRVADAKAAPPALPAANSFTRDLDFSGALRSIVKGDGAGAAGGDGSRGGGGRTITIYRGSQPVSVTVPN
ncbi:Flp pilus assembly protein CpaB [Azospirillum sp.]|uniref:Flp pilus assembly protein CpaB n=1 Tax=Azospirillum sp. TaxID=34012 RepID=UPI002D359C66|nr:Flp pilus assembly protein CpaB [Azospirillum sp.]HYD69887.1 Flp pilus assembly protein CpaB [Azospirillum sp.]